MKQYNTPVISITEFSQEETVMIAAEKIFSGVDVAQSAEGAKSFTLTFKS